MQGPPQVWDVLPKVPPDPRVLLYFPESGDIPRQTGTHNVEAPHAHLGVLEKTLIQQVQLAPSLQVVPVVGH